MVVIYAEKSSLAKEIAARSLLRLNMSVLYVVIVFLLFHEHHSNYNACNHQNGKYNDDNYNNYGVARVAFGVSSACLRCDAGCKYIRCI